MCCVFINRTVFLVAFLLTLLLMHSHSVSAAGNIQLTIGAPISYNLKNLQDKENSTTTYASKQSGLFGFMLNMETSAHFGVGFFHFGRNLADEAPKYVYKLSGTMFDVFYRLPVPKFFNVTLGVGVGEIDASCSNQACKNDYTSIEKTKSIAYQYFLKFGVKIGKIYALEAGYHNLLGSELAFGQKNDKTKNRKFDIAGSLTSISIVTSF